jgi:hypothetical protein
MKIILATIAFFSSNPGWHSFRGRSTSRAVLSLSRRGFLELNQFKQARFTGKVFSN